MLPKISVSLLFLLGCVSTLAQTPVQEAYLKTSSFAVGSAGARFGRSVDLDDHFAVVGAPYEDSGAVGVNNRYPVPLLDSGAVCVFRRSGAWAPEAYLKPFNVDGGDHFGWSVAVSGNTVLVGAPDEASGSVGAPNDNPVAGAGAAYVFVRDETTGAWSQQAFLKPPAAFAYQQFGYSVDISGDWAVVGAPFFGDPRDKAHVFHRTGVVWNYAGALAPAASLNGRAFGTAVSISGDTIVVGAPYDGTVVYSMGSAHVFKRNALTEAWDLQEVLLPEREATQDFGAAVSISGNVVVVGAPREWSNATGVGGDSSNTAAPQSGAAFVFRRTGNLWAREAYLKASNTNADDRFGSSVAVDGDVILAGAAFEQGGATGVNGNPSLNDADRAGAVYRFTRTAGVWAGSGYLKAGNTGAGDQFGGPTDGFYALGGGGVALDGSTAIVGAALEDGGATGVDGNPADEGAVDAGAAYVFENAAPQVPDLAVRSPEGATLFNAVSTVNFGLTVTGGDAQREIVLQNLGTGNLTISSLGITGTHAGDFAVIASPAAPIAAGAEATVRVRFAPVTEGARTASLVVTSDDPDQPSHSVKLVGLAVSVDDSGSGFTRIQEEAYLKASNTDAQDGFGGAGRVAISGDTVAVGAPGEDSAFSGANVSPTADPSQESNLLENSGAVYIFVRNATSRTWHQQAVIKAANPGAFDYFGAHLALDGDTLVVGSRYEDGSAAGVNGTPDDNLENSGAAYIFQRSGTIWSQAAYLKSDHPVSYPALTLPFGGPVAVHGDTILVGAPGESVTVMTGGGPESITAAGAVYVFREANGGWHQESRLTAANAYHHDSLGISLGIWGDTAVVGAPSRNGTRPDLAQNVQESSGAVYVFERTTSTWTESAMIQPQAPYWNDQFGLSLAIDGTSLHGLTLIVGAPGDDSVYTGVLGSDPSNLPKGLERCGAAYVYRKTGTGGFVYNAYLKPSNAVDGWLNDYHNDDLSYQAKGMLFFGCSVALSGDVAIVGALEESAGGRGINPVNTGAKKRLSGAAYTYKRDASAHWSEESHIKSSNADPQDNFGSSVAISGRIAVVGAEGEASSARGVNGDGSNNMAPLSGAVYVLSGMLAEPEIEITRADTGAGVASGATVAFPPTPPGRTRALTFRLANLGDRGLALSPHPLPDISMVGDTGQFSITSQPADPVAAGSNTTFTVSFTPAGTGNRSASISIINSDQDEGAYVIHFSGHAPTPVEDLDGDGIPDAEEFDLETAGFRAGQDDSARVGAIEDHAVVFGLYHPADLQTLVVDAPLIFHNPATDEITLTLGLQKSELLPAFTPFPATAPQVHVNPQGKIEFTFPATDPRAFFRVEAR